MSTYIPQAALATHAHESRSDKYAFISTADVLGALSAEGFEVAKTITQRVRSADRVGFERHQLRLRPAGFVAARAELGTLIPEVILTNSHDGTSGFRLDAGLFRLVCNNGLTVAQGEQAAISVPHRGNNAIITNRVIEGTFEVLDVANRSLVAANDWSQIELHRTDREAFAHAAGVARWGVDEAGRSLAPVTPTESLRTRRWDDRAPTLWNTYNVLQENLVERGGVRGVSSTGRRLGVRAVTGISEGSNLNRALWLLAQHLGEARGAAVAA